MNNLFFWIEFDINLNIIRVVYKFKLLEIKSTQH